MKSCLTTCAFLLLSIYSGRAQNKSYLDSLNQVSKSYACIDNETYDSLSLYIIQEAEENDLSEQLGDALVIRGYSYICSGDLKESVNTLRKALSLFESTKSMKGQANAYHHMIGYMQTRAQSDAYACICLSTSLGTYHYAHTHL